MNLVSLGDLRLWHWRAAMSARHHQLGHERDRDFMIKNKDKVPKSLDRLIDSNKQKADFHIKAVQALNDVVPGTAEADDVPERKTGPR
ncbi:hypothetical protein CPT_Sonora_083 [Stenotrophomonas phage Sonora]|nr:hypothetical protein CPT_Sonora_083 [Stenotrophomonas phage Sonora]